MFQSKVYHQLYKQNALEGVHFWRKVTQPDTTSTQFSHKLTLIQLLIELNEEGSIELN